MLTEFLFLSRTDSRFSKFKMFKVSVNFTVKMVIQQTINKTGEDCKDWAVTEAVERGDGQWDKVSQCRNCLIMGCF